MSDINHTNKTSQNSCPYERISGVHYPVGSFPSSPTPTETSSCLCQNEAQRFSPAEYKRITDHRTANRGFVPAQFEICFLQEILDISRTKGIELAIGFDHQSGRLYSEQGLEGETQAHDVTEHIMLLHTHPRATLAGGPVTTFSRNDLYGLLAFAMAQNSAAIATVIGIICSGKMEISAIAVYGDVLYVTNNREKIWIERVLTQLPLPTQLKDLMTLRKMGRFQVVVDSDKVNATGSKYKLPPKAQTQILQNFRTIR